MVSNINKGTVHKLLELNSGYDFNDWQQFYVTEGCQS